jgi:hypothetical protein
VSLWSRERIEVRLAPHAIALRRLSRGTRVRELGSYHFEVEAVNGTHDWKPALAMLNSRFEALAWRKADLDVVLSGHFTRLMLMPWTANVSEQDAAAYARHQFNVIYGSNADAWSVCLGVAHPRRPRVAAAIEIALIEALTAQAASYDMRLCSLRPLLSSLVDALPANDQALSGWVALAEPGSVHVACLDAGHCIDIRGARYEADAAPVLLSLLRESALNTDRDTEHAQVKLFAATAPDCTLLRQHGWCVENATPEFA